LQVNWNDAAAQVNQNDAAVEQEPEDPELLLLFPSFD
jgi:hypothetical protein